MMINKITVCVLTGFFCSSNNVFADQIEDNGSALQIIIPAVALGTSLFYEKNNDHEGTKQFAQSLATTLFITGALKKITHKKRPDGSNYNAFPSGHTSAAFMGASFIHERYGLRYAIAPYLAAGYTGYTRVHAKKHDNIDVLAGAAVGILSTRYFTTSYKKNMTIAPLISDNTLGVNLTKQW